MKDQGFPVHEFASSRKTRDSLVTKLLAKRQASGAQVFDMVRFRLVTGSVEDIIPVVVTLTERLFGFNLTVPGESHNSIFDFREVVRRHGAMAAMIPRLQVGLKYEDEMRPPGNGDTGRAYRDVNFIVDMPLRLTPRDRAAWAPTGVPTPAIIHVTAEFQIVDRATHEANQVGEASHERYRARRMENVRRRLERGILTWKDEA